jgi:hypothetical protein
MRCESVNPFAIQADASLGRPLQPDDNLEEGALSGAVGTDDGDDFAGVDPECHAVDGRETAEALRDSVYLEQQVSTSRATTAADTESEVAT